VKIEKPARRKCIYFILVKQFCKAYVYQICLVRRYQYENLEYYSCFFILMVQFQILETSVETDLIVIWKETYVNEGDKHSKICERQDFVKFILLGICKNVFSSNFLSTVHIFYFGLMTQHIYIFIISIFKMSNSCY